MIPNGIVGLRRCNFRIMVRVRRDPMCPLPVPVFLQRVAGVHSTHGEIFWEYTGRNAVLVGAASDGNPDTLDFMFLRRCRCAFPSHQWLKLPPVLRLLVICLYDATCFQYVVEINIVSRDRLGFRGEKACVPFSFAVGLVRHRPCSVFTAHDMGPLIIVSIAHKRSCSQVAWESLLSTSFFGSC